MKIIIVIFLSILFLAGCSDNNENNNTVNNANATRISTNATIEDNNNYTNNAEIINVAVFDNNSVNQTQNQINSSESDEQPNEEVEIASFTTKILTDDTDRENNISITCSKINNYTIKSGETFSFTNTVGKATYDKGYEKADIFDANGNKTKGLGGGNCQVSSTLYNAVMAADLEVVERHPHSSKVYYVPDGKDAAVAYGSLDFKFKNTTNNDIKIYSSSTDDEVSIRIVKISK